MKKYYIKDIQANKAVNCFVGEITPTHLKTTPEYYPKTRQEVMKSLEECLVHLTIHTHNEYGTRFIICDHDDNQAVTATQYDTISAIYAYITSAYFIFSISYSDIFHILNESNADYIWILPVWKFKKYPEYVLSDLKKYNISPTGNYPDGRIALICMDTIKYVTLKLIADFDDTAVYNVLENKII